ncbi:MAG: hypothetical protein HYT61_00255 [Candidatus Yanofskybacteria bacterium]|nr:hypothetical protein [Candidatus Yanofskybacteria bacterium]
MIRTGRLKSKAMRILWKNKFLVWNLAALIFIKVFFSYSGLQFASLVDSLATFSKEEVISQTNTLRQNLGLGILKENPVLDVAALQKLQDMIQNQYFAHSSPAGVSPWYWMDTNQYKYNYAGENLAIGFLTAKDTVDAWANSPSHRENLLNSNYKEIGIAIAPAKIANSQGFLVVQLFGTPKPTVPSKTIAQTRPPIKTPDATPIAISLSPKEPVISKIDNISSRFNKITQIFNATFILYALAAFLFSIVLLSLYGLKRASAIRTATSFAILILAVAIPVLQTTHTALII